MVPRCGGQHGLGLAGISALRRKAGNVHGPHSGVDLSASALSPRVAAVCPRLVRRAAHVGRCRDRHPCGQQNTATIRLLDHKVKQTAMDDSPERSNTFASAWMMRIVDDNFEPLFLGTMSWACAASAKAGS